MDRNHVVRRIMLPSGKTIEVVRFDGLADASAGEELHVCLDCESELVQPLEWRATEDDRWDLTLHCPNCDWSRRGIYSHAQVDALEEQLDLGVESIVEDLQRLTSANMADQIDRFAAALEVDLILPEDF